MTNVEMSSESQRDSRVETLTAMEQLALKLASGSSVVNDIYFVPHFRTYGKMAHLPYEGITVEDIIPVTQALESKGLLRRVSGSPPELLIREITEDGKRALRKSRDQKGYMRQPVTVTFRESGENSSPF